MSETEIRVGACRCPQTPHADGDMVTLRPMLGLAAGIEVQRLMVESNQAREDAAVITGRLAEAYLLHGVESWNLVGDNGQPIPVNADSIRLYLLNDFSRAAPVADAADDLYMDTVLGPLVDRVNRSLPTTLTNGSTSANRAGKSKRPTRSKPSLTSTSQTEDIVTTSA